MRLTRARMNKNLSQEDLAVALKVSRVAVSAWECGRSFPKSRNLIRCAKLLEVTAEWLIGK